MAIGRARTRSGLSAARPRHDHDTSTGELFASNLFFAGSAGFGARLLRLALRGCGALDAVVRGMRRGQAPDPRGWGMRIFTLCLSQMWLWRLLAPLGGVPTSLYLEANIGFRRIHCEQHEKHIP